MDTLTLRQESIDEITTTDGPVNGNSKIEELNSDNSVKDNEISNDDESSSPVASSKPKNTGVNRLKFWMQFKSDPEEESSKEEPSKEEQSTSGASTGNGVILCSEEKSMTMQLNGLSNIVLRVLLLGDDQELLILSETLADNENSFVDRWYPDTGPLPEKMEDETRPGVQYLNALISLLREAYKEGTVTTLEPITPLTKTYSNSYERLVASLVEMGSGYIRPEAENVMSMPKPRTALEEFGRFAVWESTFRSRDDKPACPEDLEGEWEVKDIVGGETIGVSKVTFAPKVSF